MANPVSNVIQHDFGFPRIVREDVAEREALYAMLISRSPARMMAEQLCRSTRVRDSLNGGGLTLVRGAVRHSSGVHRTSGAFSQSVFFILAKTFAMAYITASRSRGGSLLTLARPQFTVVADGMRDDELPDTP
jgi:hypothetical protein